MYKKKNTEYSAKIKTVGKTKTNRTHHRTKINSPIVLEDGPFAQNGKLGVSQGQDPDLSSEGGKQVPEQLAF